MCGLVACFGQPAAAIEPAPLKRALDRMHNRGPDAEGIWQEPGVWLGHRRLAILDLDERANQPMRSACGRYVIVFNGEIYNFRELRSELAGKGFVFRTSSDTEVLLPLFAQEGAAMLSRLRGMFALVIWDSMARRAFAARDPYGIKPLYWAQTDEGVLLASQVKALLATGKVSRAPCALGQAGFWQLGSVAEPHTWYRDVRALPAGHCAWIEEGRMGAPECWHDVAAAWRDAPASPPPVARVREQVHAALRESVAAHLVADVPVGVFLSGGIDSGALAGLMVEAGARDLQGITIAYDEFAGTHDDEAPLAATLAAHYGIAHHVRRVTRDEFAQDLPRILDAMDQPSVDGINTWYASKAVAELGLKVVVSGVGGDELFQGYESFRQLPRLVSRWRAASRIPGAMPLARMAMSLQAARSGNPRWRYLPDWARSMAGAWFLRRSVFSVDELPALMGQDLAAEALIDFCPENWVDRSSGILPADGALAVGQIESTTYLRNQLLRDVSPALRAFAQFPNKRLLAEAPGKALPDALINRRKTGFSIPVQRWLNELGRVGESAGGSRGWAREVARAYGEGSP